MPSSEPDVGYFPEDSQSPLAVYLHWPYCARICPYCDFNVHLDRRAGEGDALIRAMVEDLRDWRGWTGPRTVGSVHFGGGTPSLLTRDQLKRLVTEIEGLWGLPKNCEIALEANPNDISEARLDDWRGAGMTRLSIGAQSFDDDVLKRLGRDHDGAQAGHALKQAIHRFRSVSADLIFGVAGEKTGRLERDLNRLLSLGVPHISTYQLTIEPGTAFARAESRGDKRAVDDERSADDFDVIRARLTAAGYRHYEISNFALPGHESAHNLAYWRGQDYVGVGPGAHGRLWTQDGRVETQTVLRPADYIDRPRVERSLLSAEEAAQEYVLMGLRIADGLSLSRLAAIAGKPVTIDPDLVDEGLLRIDGDRLFATEKGRPVLDALTRAVLLG